MADAYARICNKPGAVEMPSGAGAMYALPAIAEAQGSSVPQILIASDTPLAGEGRGVITELDCAPSFLVKSAAAIVHNGPAFIDVSARGLYGKRA
jgi:acetolactate synthase-1/2/3 large subunit